MDEDDVRARVNAAMDAFRAADTYLLEHDLSERCIASRLALHLQAVFLVDGLIVDVEYNRDGNQVKRMALPPECQRLEQPTDDPVMVVPDIIVHRRGHDGPNLLVME